MAKLGPNMNILVPRTSILGPHITILAPHMSILASHMAILGPRMSILASHMCILVARTDILGPRIESLVSGGRDPDQVAVCVMSRFWSAAAGIVFRSGGQWRR